ncbi:hypothetical protein [Vibrio sp. Hal054]|uniref:hypothetical protein n=1 Tax=Vibrio sp. Hal054 TaxID=3035158 RepID=UPI00301DDF2F
MQTYSKQTSPQMLSQVREALAKLDSSMPLKADDKDFFIFAECFEDADTGEFSLPLEIKLLIVSYDLDIQPIFEIEEPQPYTVGLFLEHTAKLPDMPVKLCVYGTRQHVDFNVVRCAPCRPHDLDEQFYMFMSEDY